MQGLFLFQLQLQLQFQATEFHPLLSGELLLPGEEVLLFEVLQKLQKNLNHLPEPAMNLNFHLNQFFLTGRFLQNIRIHLVQYYSWCAPINYTIL